MKCHKSVLFFLLFSLLACSCAGRSFSEGFREAYPLKFPSFTKRHKPLELLKKPISPITDCMTVLMEPGSYRFDSKGRSETCGVYITSDSNHLIEVEVDKYDVSCETGGLISFFDGWELNGRVFPSKQDHQISFEDRFREFCSSSSMKRSGPMRFVSSQNAALIQYKVPASGEGFTISFKTVENLEPCNVLMTANSGTFFLKNRGKPKNCSLTTLLFPANLKIENMNVGIKSDTDGSADEYLPKTLKDKRVFASCNQHSHSDYIEFGGSAELDSSELSMKQMVCGVKTQPAKKALTILCGSTTIRLVSSGRFDNTLTISVREAEENDLNQNLNYIMVCPDYM